MSAAVELVRSGQLNDALAALQQEVRQQPGEAKLRVFLFQLLAVLGQWERAAGQLQVAGELDPAALPMVQTYREALQCEILREEIFAGHRSPLVLGDPPPWLAGLLQALQLYAQGEAAGARALREQAFEAAPAQSGSIDGTPFAWCADADERLGPVLEVVMNGRYYWVPFARIGTVRIEAPTDLRDAVWTPANFTWSNGGEAVGLIPTRYAGTAASGDNALQLARRTDWLGDETLGYRGLGQRMLATDQGEYALMATREVRFDAETAAA
ncbi:MAG TPA: type VI secretion system accessory protein TagJ [Burkholderiaceae bacterium]|nr:type VI secretion system accessory protein TagJ [Burkholderiaceae bacterium]